jgi:hypothetical protein
METFNPFTRDRAGTMGNAKSRKRGFGLFATETLNGLVGATGIPGATGDCLGNADPNSVKPPIVNSGIVCEVSGEPATRT